MILMMTSNGKVLRAHNADEFHIREVLQAFYTRCTMHPEAKLQLVEKAIPKILAHISSKSLERMSILGIGSSKGDIDASILEEITKYHLEKSVSKKASIYNRVVEPEAKGIAEFTSNVEAWKGRNKDRAEVMFDMVQATFQQYQSRSEHDDTKFQFIHFIGCIHFMDPEDAIRHCLEKELANNGVIMVAFVAKDCFLTRYVEKFCKSGLCPIPLGPSKHMTTEDIMEIARKNNWRYEYFEASWYKDVTTLVEVPESRESQLILDFVTRTENFSSVTCKEIVDKVREFLLDESETKPDGRRVIEKKNMYGAVLIFSKS